MMRDYKSWKQWIEPLIIAIVPASILLFSETWIKTSENISEKLNRIIVTLIAYAFTALLYYLLEMVFRRAKWFRKYRSIEGRWIEYIEASDKPIAICTLGFNKEGYFFNGVNFPEDNRGVIREFKSRFVANTDNSFYFITSAHQDYKAQKIEGCGKVYDISKQATGYYEAKGFFFDVSDFTPNELYVKYHKTRYIKLDEKFFKYSNSGLLCPSKIKKLTDKQVYDYVKAYVIQKNTLEKEN